MKVYVVIYSNHFIESWDVMGVYANKEDAEKEETRLKNKKGDTWDRYHVEEWEVK